MPAIIRGRIISKLQLTLRYSIAFLHMLTDRFTDTEFCLYSRESLSLNSPVPVPETGPIEIHPALLSPGTSHTDPAETESPDKAANSIVTGYA